MGPGQHPGFFTQTERSIMDGIGTANEWANIARQQEAGEDHCTPRFYMRAVQNKRRTQIEGRPIFDQKPYVEIFIPGEKHNRPDRAVSDDDKARWPSAWKLFQESQEEVIEGTPIEAWPYLNRAQVAEFKALNILTIEGLANMADGLLDRLGPGGRDIQKRAQQFLKPQSDIEDDLRAEMRAATDALNHANSRIEQLEKAVAARDAEIETLEAQKPRRGRPPKNHDA